MEILGGVEAGEGDRLPQTARPEVVMKTNREVNLGYLQLLALPYFQQQNNHRFWDPKLL